MKVALFGNMNNNFFSLMRYLRDLGIDAYLLMYKNEIDHFTPENDSYNIQKWQPFIKSVDIKNGSLISLFKYSKEHLKTQLEGYDYYITNGFSPAIFNKADLRINLYLPYCVGIEYTYFYNKQSVLHWLLEPIFSILQSRGLKKRVNLLGTVDEKAKEKSLSYKLKTISLAMPMVYIENENSDVSDDVALIIESFKQYSLILFSHVSHFNFGSDGFNIKRNDRIIEGFASYIKKTNDTDAILVLLDYGPGVNDSKKLIDELELSKFVKWLPKMPRKELMMVIKHIDFGAGEFGGDMWGGTVWEFMASGKPFFQFVDLSMKQIETLLGATCPKFLNLKDREEISNVLVDYSNNKDAFINMGRDLQKWFELYGGIGLAKEYRKIILSEEFN